MLIELLKCMSAVSVQLATKGAAMTVRLPLTFLLLPSPFFTSFCPWIGIQTATVAPVWEDVQSSGFSFVNFFLCYCNDKVCDLEVVLDSIHCVIWIAATLITKFNFLLVMHFQKYKQDFQIGFLGPCLIINW